MTNPTDNQSSPDPEIENTAAFACINQSPSLPQLLENVPFKTKLKHFLAEKLLMLRLWVS